MSVTHLRHEGAEHAAPDLPPSAAEPAVAQASDTSACARQMTGEGSEARDEAEGGRERDHLCAVREEAEAEAVRTAVRESAEADEPLHSSIVTHPAAASPFGCDASIPLVRCRRGDRWTGRDRLAASPIRSDPAAGPRFERRPRRGTRALLEEQRSGQWS